MVPYQLKLFKSCKRNNVILVYEFHGFMFWVILGVMASSSGCLHLDCRGADFYLQPKVNEPNFILRFLFILESLIKSKTKNFGPDQKCFQFDIWPVQHCFTPLPVVSHLEWNWREKNIIGTKKQKKYSLQDASWWPKIYMGFQKHLQNQSLTRLKPKKKKNYEI